MTNDQQKIRRDRKKIGAGITINKSKFTRIIKHIKEKADKLIAKSNKSNVPHNTIISRVRYMVNRFMRKNKIEIDGTNGRSRMSVTNKMVKSCIKNVNDEKPCTWRMLDLLLSTHEDRIVHWSDVENRDENNSSWWFYFLKIKEGRVVLARGRFTTTNNNRAYLIEGGKSYEGEFSRPKSDAFVTLILEPKETTGSVGIVRNITLSYSEPETDYVEGFMITCAPNPVIYNNTVLLHRLEEEEEKQVLKELNHENNVEQFSPLELYSSEYYGIHHSIRSYFKNITLCSNKTKTGSIDNREDLLDVAKERNKVRQEFLYDLYISAPISSLKNAKQYEITKLVILGILKKIQKFQEKKEVLKKINDGLYNKIRKDKIFSPATKKGNEHWESACEYSKTKDRYEEAVDEWFLSKYYMLVLPFDVPSVARMQAAWVFIQGDFKPSVFIVAEEIKMPKFISGAEESMKGKGLNIALKGVPLVDDEIDNVEVTAKKIIMQFSYNVIKSIFYTLNSSSRE